MKLEGGKAGKNSGEEKKIEKFDAIKIEKLDAMLDKRYFDSKRRDPCVGSRR